MPKLLSRFMKSPEAERKARRISLAMLFIIAAVNWWIVIEDGASPARVIAGVVASLVAMIELLFPRRRRLFRRRKSATDLTSVCN